MKDPYYYDDVPVMRNKLNIKNQAALDNAESALVIRRLIDVDEKVTGHDFTVERLQQIHKYLFGAVYDWAGDLRSINVEKPEKILDGMSVNYSDKSIIKSDADKIVNRMNSMDWDTFSLDSKVQKFSRLLTQLWQVHPFREGNTRSTLTYALQFAAAHGFQMDKRVFQLNPGYYRNSLVMASLGDYAEPQHLEKIIRDAISGGMERSHSKESTQLSANAIAQYCNSIERGSVNKNDNREFDR